MKSKQNNGTGKSVIYFIQFRYSNIIHDIQASKTHKAHGTEVYVECLLYRYNV